MISYTASEAKYQVKIKNKKCDPRMPLKLDDCNKAASEGLPYQLLYRDIIMMVICVAPFETFTLLIANLQASSLRTQPL